MESNKLFISKTLSERKRQYFLMLILIFFREQGYQRLKALANLIQSTTTILVAKIQFNGTNRLMKTKTCFFVAWDQNKSYPS
jgi:hypothetical protein